MKKLFKIVGVIIFTIFTFIALLPKVDLYYKLEHILKEEKIVISNEMPVDKILFFNLKDAKVYYNDISICKFLDSNFYAFILYNNLTVKNIVLDKSMKIFLPEKIERVNLTYSIYNPLEVKLSSTGDFGEAEGFFNLKTRKLHIVLTPSANMKKNHANTLSMMKSKNGKYIYDKVL